MCFGLADFGKSGWKVHLIWTNELLKTDTNLKAFKISILLNTDSDPTNTNSVIPENTDPVTQ